MNRNEHLQSSQNLGLYQQIKQLHDEIDTALINSWQRSLLLNEVFIDRWEHAQKQGFGLESSIYKIDCTSIFGHPQVSPKIQGEVMGKINRVLFMGSKSLGLRVLKKIHALSPATLIGAVTIDDSKDTRTKFTDFQAFTDDHEVELHVAKNRIHSEQIIQELKPDLCFVVGWYWLISNAALDAVPFGFIGIHSSLLPKFRGGSPLIWQIIRGEKEYGFSFFSFTPGIDEGGIWAQGRVSIDRHDYISSVLEKLENKVIEVLQHNYLEILNGSIKPVEQNHELATYCAQRFPRDGNIDWRKPAQEVFNFIRAQSDPYPGAFSFFEAQEMKIWKARLFEKPYFGTPGQVARITSDEVFIICGDDRAIVLEEVELCGKRGKATDFIKSFKGKLSNLVTESMVDIRA
jgi:methionyl-tRNA formyltransferase